MITGEIYNLKKIQEERKLTQEELSKLHYLRVQIQQVYDKEEIIWNQRARINWIKQGDLNTTCFHKTANMRNSENAILKQESREVIIEDEDRTRGVNYDHFKNLFSLLDSSQMVGICPREWLGKMATLPNPFLRMRSKQLCEVRGGQSPKSRWIFNILLSVFLG